MNLIKFYSSHTGKVSDKWESYLYTYDEILQPYKNKPISLLEIGVQNGGSLEIWEKFFLKGSKFIGMDIDPKCMSLKYKSNKVNVLIGDASQKKSIKKVTDKISSFDIIIDDGSHFNKHMIQSFCLYFPYLKKDGIYVIEDMHTSYWFSHGGHVNHPFSAISFFKNLSDIINYEFWGKDKELRQSVLIPFFKEYNCTISEKELSNIHSIKFLNSMCVIEKKTGDQNLLGKRIVRGKEDLVRPLNKFNSKLKTIDKGKECYNKIIYLNLIFIRFLNYFSVKLIKYIYKKKLP